MFGFVSKLKRRWRQDPSDLLLASDMERQLIKERVRCDRFGHYFSLIVIQFNRVPEVSMQTQQECLARYLRNRLRITDECGHLLKGGIGVLLPMTSVEGGQFVCNDVVSFARENGLSIEADVYGYEGRDGGDPFSPAHFSTSSHSDDSESDSTDHLISMKSDQEVYSSTASTVAITRPTVEMVRADAITQISVEQKATLLAHCCKPYPVWKRLADIAGASIGLCLASPILLVAACAIKISSKGPVLFQQSRCGQYGRPFRIYKLRTMAIDAEETKHLLLELNERDGPAFKIKNDPRVTTIGQFLRKTGLDELPQLVNVLLGDMSLVGPRPLPVKEDNQCASWQQRRLDTKPGITCLWQISKSRKISFDDWMRLDLQYLRRRSVWFDVSLLLRTIKAVVLGRVGH